MFKLSSLQKVYHSLSVTTLIALLILGVGAIGLAYGVHQTSTTGNDSLQLKARSVSTTTPITSTNSFTIPELGVELSLPSGLTSDDLQYYAQIGRPGTAADPHLWSTISFTTRSLQQLDSECTAAEGSIGMVVRYSEDPKAIRAEVRESRPLGSYYVAFAAPQGSCSMSPDAQKLESTQIRLLQQAFETITMAN